MLKQLTIAALTAAVASTAAISASANDQLAASLGVEPGVYSTVELIRLRDAIEENNQREVSFILNSGAETIASVDTNVPLAVAAGVTPGQFSTSELVRLRRAQEDNNTQEVNFILAGVGSTEVTQGSQFADGLSAEVSDLSAVEVIRLRRALEDNKTHEVNFILNN